MPSGSFIGASRRQDRICSPRKSIRAQYRAPTTFCRKGLGSVERVGGLFASRSPCFNLIKISQPELFFQSRQQTQQLPLVFFRVCLMCKFCINGALEGRNSQRIKFRAVYEMMIGYFSCALTELINRYVPLEVPLEEFHHQQPFGAESTAPVGEVNGYEDSDEKRSPNDSNYCVAVHGPRLHVAGLLASQSAISCMVAPLSLNLLWPNRASGPRQQGAYPTNSPRSRLSAVSTHSRTNLNSFLSRLKNRSERAPAPTTPATSWNAKKGISTTKKIAA
jgi:hypothetical protein